MAMAFLLPVRCLLMIEPLNANQSKVSCSKRIDRLNLPSAMVSDGPHGLRKEDDSPAHFGLLDSIEAICFPTASALACSFDRELIENVGNALGKECQSEDISVLLGPGINMKRSPLCGRNFEYFQ